MKATCGVKFQSLVLAAALSVGLGFLSPAFAANFEAVIENPDGAIGLRTVGTDHDT